MSLATGGRGVMGISGEGGGREMRACIDIPMTHDTILGKTVGGVRV